MPLKIGYKNTTAIIKALPEEPTIGNWSTAKNMIQRKMPMLVKGK